MRKNLSLSLLLIATLMTPLVTMAQTWQWGNRFGRNGGSVAGMGIDNSGNVYVGGNTYSYPIFDTVHITQHPMGSGTGYLGYIAKYSCEGNLKWVKTMLSNQGNDVVSGVVVDNQGNSYLTGRSDYDSAWFGGTIHTSGVTSHLNWFLAKYDSNGTFKWVTFTDAGAPINEYGSTIGINSAGVIIVAGRATIHSTGDSLIFPGIYIHSSSGNMESFVAGFDPYTGTALWAKNVDKIAPGTNWGGFPSYTGMVIDNNDNIYFAGTYSDTCEIGTQVLYAPHLANHSVIAKFDPTGTNRLFANTITKNRINNFFISRWF